MVISSRKRWGLRLTFGFVGSIAFNTGVMWVQLRQLYHLHCICFQIADSTIPSELGLSNYIHAWLWEVAKINENVFGFTLQQVGSVSNSFHSSSYQPPLKIIVGWILIDLFQDFFFKRPYAIQFMCIMRINRLQNVTCRHFQQKTVHISKKLNIRIYTKHIATSPIILIFVPKALFLALKIIF